MDALDWILRKEEAPDSVGSIMQGTGDAGNSDVFPFKTEL